MKIINLKQKHLFIYSFQDFGSSFVIKMQHLGQIWILNCSEGCQHILARKKIKISQITKIIITDLSIKNISGLLGLLSSLSLNTSIRKIDLYGPNGLVNYLFLGRKYSQTNFRYTLSVHNIETGIIAQNQFYQIYAFTDLSFILSFNCYILISEKPGRFNLLKVICNKVPLGPLYGELKMGNDFILPDGYTVYGNNFINSYYLGDKILFLSNYSKRQCFEAIKNSRVIFYK
uniref:hypothetical protein n=1 Tax=Lithothamnion corallioides TaxID=1277934 RepID=UPI0023F3F834|nr:hypothetical protein P6G75_pgp101 [Lithothamnion corallioides]WEA77133.1 hypothetical protein [Lithothamnion corallioides]